VKRNKPLDATGKNTREKPLKGKSVKEIKKGPLDYGKGTGGPVTRPFTRITQGRINALLVDGGYIFNIAVLQKKVKENRTFSWNFFEFSELITIQPPLPRIMKIGGMKETLAKGLQSMRVYLSVKSW
jgi:hypothetical protein